ncbi:YuzF family protein [Terribacillus saccharophilus]|uniref:YuzF family protein n=1 Tax=Terribacillus saccharophilus TaxID=361277 RepID=UPI002DC07DF3|nr:YuzF family protein [Terribacillus saccharophilus]
MNQPQQTTYVSSVDPYVYQTLQGVRTKQIVVETVRGSVTGKLITVRPDHIVVESGGSSFFIRTAQIVWVIPRG